MACLDDAQILDLVGGQLDGPALDAADSHLDQCPDCRAVLSGLARTQSSEGHGAPAANAHLARGAEVGRFVVLDLIGGGAMGLVYAAYDPQLDRRVALKILKRAGEPGTDVADARLLGEARAMARLNHPNVVQIHDVGKLGDTVYLAMALIDGLTLSAWCKSVPRRWQDVRDVFEQAGRGLVAAHDAGLVHRDFKPDNVIVGRDNHARVTDFGLASGALERGVAALTGEHGADNPLAIAHTQTRTGALVGTPAYMSPEQLRGEPADARSDQFSFCVALFEALYGTRPFPADSLEDLVARVTKDTAVARPTSNVPRWLHAIVCRGLSRRPADRFASMDELLEAMQLRPAVSRRAWVPTGLVVAGLVVVGALLSRSADQDPLCSGAEDELARVWNDKRRSAVHAGIRATKATFAADVLQRLDGAVGNWSSAWTATHTATCRATRVTKQQSTAVLDARMSCLGRRLGELDALLDQLASADTATAARALDAVAALPPLDDCADVTSLLSVPPPPQDEQSRTALTKLHAQVATVRATIALGAFGRAAAQAAAAVGAAEQLGYAPLIAEAKLVHADALRRSGKAAAADPIAFDALFAAQASRDDRNVAHAWLLLVTTAGERGAYREARSRLRHARAAVKRLGPTPRLDAAIASAAGIIAYNMKEYDASARALSLALQIRTRSLGADHIDVARTYTSLGNLARARGALDESLTHHRRAQAIDRTARGDTHPTAGRHLHNIAGVLRRQKKLDEALATYRRALALKAERLGAAHPDVALTHNSIGLVHFERGQLDDAATSYRTALRIYGDRDSAPHADTLYNLALVDAARARPGQAKAHLAAAIRIYQTSYGSGHPEVARLQGIAGTLRGRAVIATPATKPTPRPTRKPKPTSARAPTPAPTPVSEPTPNPNPTPKKPPGVDSKPTYGAGQAWD